jgi:hypothetical protein
LCEQDRGRLFFENRKQRQLAAAAGKEIAVGVKPYLFTKFSLDNKVDSQGSFCLFLA